MDITPGVAIFALVIPAAFAAIGYKLGERKNQPIAGLFLGMFLGPIGLIVVALSEAKEQGPAQAREVMMRPLTPVGAALVIATLGGCVATAADLRRRAVDESFTVPANVDVLADRIARVERFGSRAQCLYRTGVFVPGSHSEFEISGTDPIGGVRYPPTGTVELHADGPAATRVELRLKRTIWGGYQADPEPIRAGIHDLANVQSGE